MKNKKLLALFFCAVFLLHAGPSQALTPLNTIQYAGIAASTAYVYYNWEQIKKKWTVYGTAIGSGILLKKLADKYSPKNNQAQKDQPKKGQRMTPEQVYGLLALFYMFHNFPEGGGMGPSQHTLALLMPPEEEDSLMRRTDSESDYVDFFGQRNYLELLWRMPYSQQEREHQQALPISQQHQATFLAWLEDQKRDKSDRVEELED